MKLYSKFQKRLATLVVGTFLATSVYSPILANDYENHWAKEAIEKWKDKGVVNGYEDGTFKPKQAITRAELAKIIVEIFGLNNTSHVVKYSDVSEDAWYSPYVQAVSSAKIMNDSSDKFNPNTYATREEAAYAIAMAYKVSGGNADFKDSDDISSWASEKVGALAANGYIDGRNDGNFAPKDSLTRADVITMIDKITADLVNKSGTYSKDIKGNLVVNSGDVVLKNMVVDGNLYVAEGVGEGDVTLDNVKVNGKVFLEGAGENSFKCVNGSKLNEVEVNKANNKPVRIYQDKSCSIEKVDTLSDCIIDGKGAFNEVNVESKCNVEVKQATVKTLNIRVESKIKTSSGSIIGTLICDAVVTVTGNGTIENCSVNIVGCKLEVAPKNTFFIDANIKISIGSKEYGKDNINDAVKDTQSNNNSSNNSSTSNNSSSNTNNNNNTSNNSRPLPPSNQTTTDSNYKPVPPQNNTTTSSNISVNPNYDITAPKVKSISIDKKEVRPGDIITVTLDIEDDSEIRYAVLYFETTKVSGQKYRLYRRCELNKETGMYEAKLEISDVNYQGEYILSNCDIEDTYKNEFNVYSHNGSYVISNNGSYEEDASDMFKNLKFNIVNGVQDITAPIIKSIKVDKDEVSVGETLTVIMDIEEESEIKSGRMEFETIKPSGQKYSVDAQCELNKETGMYEAKFRIDSKEYQGEYTCVSLRLLDIYGNNIVIDNQNKSYLVSVNGDYSEEAKEVYGGWSYGRRNGNSNNYISDIFKDVKFNIVNDVQDITSPIIKSIKVDKDEVSVGETLTVIMDIEEESEIDSTYIRFETKNVNGKTYSLVGELEFNKETGMYEAKIKIDDKTVQGEYMLYTYHIRDIYRNESFYYAYKDNLYKDIKFKVINNKIVIDTDINIELN